MTGATRPIPVKPAGKEEGTIRKDWMTGCPLPPKKCWTCEYEQHCFSLLHFIQLHLYNICRQGRKRKGKTEVPDALPQTEGSTSP